jgi:phage N-6-adenine-methyltransferase
MIGQTAAVGVRPVTTLAKVKTLLAVSPKFIASVQAFPAKVDEALALVSGSEDAVKLLHEADTLAHFAARVKADTQTINCIQYGKLKIVNKLGELMPRGEKQGRGKKSPKPALGLSDPTVATYRKVHDHAEKIDDYYEEASKDEGETEMSLSGFIRYVASDGNLKSHQNKGVIEWYTPAEYIEAARAVMGSIDLDPASNRIAQKVVCAGEFYTKDDDGLALEWRGTVFLNPPFQASLAKPFISKLCESHKSGAVPQAVLLTNNNTDTAWWHEAAECCACICFTKGRINFYSPAGEIAQPTNGHTLFYFGGRAAEFSKVFAAFGLILKRAD